MTPESPGGEGLTDLVRELAEMLDHAIVCELEEAEMAAALDATKRARAALAALPASPALRPAPSVREVAEKLAAIPALGPGSVAFLADKFEPVLVAMLERDRADRASRPAAPVPADPTTKDLR